MTENSKPQKPKKPTAKKRVIQSQKRNLINKAFKSRVRTSLNKLTDFAEKKDKESLTQELNTINSLMDKGVKRGIYKQNKANRVKSNAAKLVAKG